MNAVSGIFVALTLVLGGGYALGKIYATVKTAAVERIQKGTSPLSKFTGKLTCSKFSSSGDFVSGRCRNASGKPPIR